MFGSRSGSPYPGATGLLNSGNASAGPGGPLSTAGNVPPPSGGMPQSSVYNRTLDNEPNVVPSQFMFPSSHPALKGDNNKIREGDLLFVIRDLNNCFGNEGAYADGYRTRQARLSKDEVPLVTIQKLNELLRDAAKFTMSQGGATSDVSLGALELKSSAGTNLMEDKDGNVESLLILDTAHWWQNPELVSQWAVPLGAALNSVQLNRYGSGGEPNNRANREDWQAHNVVVSRKANLKNNFYSIKAHKGEKWHSQSMQRVGVQYALEQVRLGLGGASDLVYCVQCTCLLLDDPCHIKGQTFLGPYQKLFPKNLRERRIVPAGNDDGIIKKPALPSASDDATKKELEPIVYNHAKANGCQIENTGYHLFEEKPMGDPAARVIVPIGRVLHSAPRQPSAYECLTSCINKYVYDSLKPIEIELGCP